MDHGRPDHILTKSVTDLFENQQNIVENFDSKYCRKLKKKSEVTKLSWAQELGE